MLRKDLPHQYMKMKDTYQWKKNEKLNSQNERSQKRFKSEAHGLINEKVNKIILSLNDDKRLQ